MIGRPPSPFLIEALKLVRDGKTVFYASKNCGVHDSRIWVALARWKHLPEISERAKVAILRFAGEDVKKYENLNLDVEMHNLFHRVT